MAAGATTRSIATDPDVLVYRITGAFFFGAASTVGTVLDSIADSRKSFVVDFSAVPFLDSTAANAMGRVATRAQQQGGRLFITGASPAVRRELITHGVSPPRAKFRETVERAVADIKGYNSNAGRRCAAAGLRRKPTASRHHNPACRIGAPWASSACRVEMQRPPALTAPPPWPNRLL